MTYLELLDAVNKFFNDTRRPKEETAEDLRGLKDEIDTMIESLEL